MNACIQSLALVLCVLAGRTLFAQTLPAVNDQEGIPVEHPLVTSTCGGCHKADAQKRMSRISYIRASPENWENIIKRMVSLNGAEIDPAAARSILKYLADNHGLAPEEAATAAFYAEKRSVEFTYEADRETAVVCSSCHSIGQVMSERRTKQEWELLLAMHRGFYPLVDTQPMNNRQGFRRTRTPEGQNQDLRHPMERIVDHLSKAYPLRTAEWAAWSAARTPPALAGRWTLSGYMAGKGPVVGYVDVEADAGSPDTFLTRSHYVFARTGERISRTGRSVVYGSFQWRGRSASATAGGESWREVLQVDRSSRSMSGRWFTGGYDEIGVDVRLERLGSDAVVLGASLPALRAGAQRVALRIHGANFPPSPRTADVSLGQGVTVSRIVSATADAITVEVDISADAIHGPRDIRVRSASRPASLVVFDKVDWLKVSPRAGLARVGGVVIPKQVQQFEALALHRGADGEPNTGDDWSLGAVDVTWSLEEYTATFNDDDVAFVGSLDGSGLFTPGPDGPNAERSGNRNNMGDVWVVADLPPTPSLGTTGPMRGRAQLVVTAPVFVRWWEPSVPNLPAPAEGKSR